MTFTANNTTDDVKKDIVADGKAVSETREPEVSGQVAEQAQDDAASPMNEPGQAETKGSGDKILIERFLDKFGEGEDKKDDDDGK
ncbi:hypothetical protein OPT61_g3014 [Boeremia exigua]|uniref:Uncharacterized protein n=1 Tax=Boeremia exigua TaxID=749465 RepID=A0ACC2IJE0_9PLEO|nr:hypothetical protein OPT61_g3014 [Boeremia exigua]